MKCYFTFNNDIEGNETYTDLLVGCLKSAKENTSLELNALYDGTENDKLFKILKNYGVTVHICQLSFYNLLEHFYSSDYKKQTGMQNMRLPQAACNFMKFEIPLYEKEDEIVLYSDIDVLFMKDLNLSSLSTKTLAAAPEFVPDYSIIKGYRYFNAGVMLLNVPELARRRQKLLTMLQQKQPPYQECWDQGFFNELYKNDFDNLPLIYNWKPYWGINKDACICHLHGYKPQKNLSSDPIIGGNLVRFDDAFRGWIYYFNYFYKTIGKYDEIFWTDFCEFLMREKINYIRKYQFKFSYFLTYKLWSFLSTQRFAQKGIMKKIINSMENKLKKKGIIDR